jgi:Arc/MetJ-type ribon-helix-helix transcriptional regulator
VRESKVTVKIPRPLYRKIQQVVDGSGFNSPTDFIVYVLRDLMGEAEELRQETRAVDPTYSEEEIDEVKRKLKNLGYL